MGYDQDFYLWTREQAESLRAAGRSGTNMPIDWENVAEEIEGLGGSQRRELGSRIAVILEHLLKLQSSPAAEPRAGWRATILRERSEIALLLDDSPSLRREVTALIQRRMPLARRIVAQELADHDEHLAQLPDFAEEQVLGDWLP